MNTKYSEPSYAAKMNRPNPLQLFARWAAVTLLEPLHEALLTHGADPTSRL